MCLLSSRNVSSNRSADKVWELVAIFENGRRALSRQALAPLPPLCRRRRLPHSPLDCRIKFKWILIVNIDNNNTAPSRAVIARQLQIELRCVSLGSEVSENRQVGGWHLSLLSYRWHLSTLSISRFLHLTGASRSSDYGRGQPIRRPSPTSFISCHRKICPTLTNNLSFLPL